MRASEVAAAVGGVLHGDDVELHGVSTDSRATRAGEMFVTLHGPSFDGHDFLPAAASAGAVAALAERRAGPLPVVVVDDARAALGRLAANWRRRFTVRSVGITGSNGKTTVKEMTAAILAQDAPVLATRGNLNNDIGVPLTLLRLDREHERLVVEMGANHPGEIAALANLARPDVAVITVVAPAHLEGFGSIDAVAQAKGEIIGALPGDGIVIVRDEEAYLGLWRELAAGRELLRFGFTDQAEVRASFSPQREGAEVTLDTPQGQVRARMRLVGRHNALNAAAATAAALAVGVPVQSVGHALAGVRPVSGRLVLHAAGDCLVLDDSYNANPDSLRAALQVLRGYPGPRYLVLGDMAELGPRSEALHRDAGRMARDMEVDALLGLGALSRHAVEAFGTGGRHFPDREALLCELRERVQGEGTVLVKGSRSMAMEQVVHAMLRGELQCC
jgi:UDP-N-acetylmuramoyl-tripeptide--D-alanyl-D-alanine ligase